MKLLEKSRDAAESDREEPSHSDSEAGDRKRKAAIKKKESSSESESEEEEEKPKKQKKRALSAKAGGRGRKKKAKVESDSESEKSEESEEKSESDQKSSSEEEEKPKKRKGRAAPKKTKAKESSSSSSDESMKSAEEEQKEEKKKRGGRKKKAAAAEESEKEESGSEAEEKKEKKQRKSKKPKKEEKKKDKKQAFRTLVPKPHLDEIEENPILSPKKSGKATDFPDKGVSILVNNREPIYRVCKGDMAGLKKLIKNAENVSTLFQNYSVDIPKNALDFALQRGETDMVKLLLAELDKEYPPTPELVRAKRTRFSLTTETARHFNRYQYGFHTRSVGASRGGKEGNAALDADVNLEEVRFPFVRLW